MTDNAWGRWGEHRDHRWDVVGVALVEDERPLEHSSITPDLVQGPGGQEAARRREARGEAAQLYEQNEVQRALAAFYKDLAAHMPADRVVIVDGVGTEDEVHARIMEAIAATCGLPET